MPDPLYLSLWFLSFEEAEILPNALSVLNQFPFSQQLPGITYLALHPVSWNEPTILERRYRPGVSPQEAIMTAAEFIHDDYGYVFEANWDIWVPPLKGSEWALQPSVVRFIAQGMEFEEGAAEEVGQIQIDLGLDSAFLHEEMELAEPAQTRIRANISKLVEFTNQLEQNAGVGARRLWSESEENLAQKLIARLQKVQ
jgi:hypothetical protein